MESSSGPSEMMRSRLYSDGFGEVEVVLTRTSLQCHMDPSSSSSDGASSCLGFGTTACLPAEILFAKIYAAKLNDDASIHEKNVAKRLTGSNSKMYRFRVLYVEKLSNHHSVWMPKAIVFSHPDLKTCEEWVRNICSILEHDKDRPKSLLVFVNPLSGKGHATKTWLTVSPLFNLAKVCTKIIKTERAGHAFEFMKKMTDEDLQLYDGVIAVGGDGFFNEVLNGMLSWRYKGPYPPPPEGFSQVNEDKSIDSLAEEDACIKPTSAIRDNDSHPFLQDETRSKRMKMEIGHGISSQVLTHVKAQGKETTNFSFPHPSFRFGIIPAGSTDTIVVSSTGARDPVTSALHIILGKRLPLDIAQVVSWQSSPKSVGETPNVRYVASFAGYGFYGDVIKESELHRWMGPARYDYAGTKVFLRHKSYEAEIAFADLSDDLNSSEGSSSKTKCLANCNCIKEAALKVASNREDISLKEKQYRWSKVKGRFLSVGAAVMSCRNDKAPDGVVSNAHLADGFFHLVLIKDCPHASYLRHLVCLARKGADPLDFGFVEHHKTTTFSFVSHGVQSVWNVDGEIFLAHKLSAQVLRGLIHLFATGPES